MPKLNPKDIEVEESKPQSKRMKMNVDKKVKKMKTKYILVSFPEIQLFMDHPRFNECIFCMEIEGHPCPDSSYMVPEDLYYEVKRK